MKKLKIILFIAFIFDLASCNAKLNDAQITLLLKSKRNDTENLITGAFEAGESKNKKFVPLLLSDVDNPGGCTNIRFKGFSVYQEKISALKKIFDIKPPNAITKYPDSVNIKFYINLAKREGLVK